MFCDTSGFDYAHLGFDAPGAWRNSHRRNTHTQREKERKRTSKRDTETQRKRERKRGRERVRGTEKNKRERQAEIDRMR